MAKIPEKAKDEIVAELERHRDRVKHRLDHADPGAAGWSYNRGMASGLAVAILVLNSWNEPNHGKVMAKPA